MTGTELAALIRYKTRTNSVTFTDTDMLPLVNTFKDEIASMIVERNAGYFLIPTVFDLVGDQREYAFPEELLNRIHKLEIKFASGDSRFPAQNIKDYQGSETESEIVKNFSNFPLSGTHHDHHHLTHHGFAYTIRRRAVFILSGTIIAVTGGARLWHHEYPAKLANMTGTANLDIDPSTTSFGFPRQFQELLARRISIEYKGAQPKPITLSPMEKKYDKDLEVQLVAITSTDNSAEVIGNLPPSADLGDDGWNY